MSAPEIIALHGNLGQPSDWEALEIPGLRAISLWEHADLSFHEFADHLARTIAGDSIKPIVAGYSLGGRLALHAMSMHPDRWGGAVIASAHPGLRTPEERQARRESDASWAELARDAPWAEFLSRWDSQSVLQDSDPSGGREELEPHRASIALAFETWSLGRQEDLRSHLRRFHAPVLWVTGERDAKFTALAAEMDEVFPALRREVLPGTGHRLLGNELAALVEEW